MKGDLLLVHGLIDESHSSIGRCVVFMPYATLWSMGHPESERNATIPGGPCLLTHAHFPPGLAIRRDIHSGWHHRRSFLLSFASTTGGPG